MGEISRVLGLRYQPTLRRRIQEISIQSISPRYDTFHGKSSGSIPASDSFAHKAGANCLTTDNTHGQYLVSGGADATIHLWDLEQIEPAGIFVAAATVSRSTPAAHSHAITAVKFWPFDPKPSILISASFDKTVKIISVTPASLQPAHTFPLDHAPYTVSLSPRPTAAPLIAVGTQATAIRLLDLRSGLGTHSLAGHNGGVFAIAWNPRHDHILASGAADGRVILFDIRRANAAFGSLDLDDSLGVVDHGNNITYETKKALPWNANARAHSGSVTSVQWTADGDKIVTAGGDNRIRMFDAATGKNDLVHFGPRIRNDRNGPLIFLLSPPGYTRSGRELLFWPNDDGKGEIHVHSLREGNLVKIMLTPGVSRRITQLKQLTSGGKINAMVWRGENAASGQGPEFFSAHGDGRICHWGPGAHDEEDTSQHDHQHGNDSELLTDAQQQEQGRKRKREAVRDLVASLSTKSPRP